MRTALVLALLLSGCHDHGGPGREPDLYEGCATDENWATFDDYAASGRTTLDATRAPRWLSPQGGSAHPASHIVPLQWQPSPTDPGRPNGNASCPDRCPSCRLLPQHLPPVSGNVFDLHFYAAGTEVYRVLTTLQSFTPPQTLWQSLAGKDVAVDIVGAALLRNEVASGPFRAEALRFRVTN